MTKLLGAEDHSLVFHRSGLGTCTQMRQCWPCMITRCAVRLLPEVLIQGVVHVLVHVLVGPHVYVTCTMRDYVPLCWPPYIGGS